MPKKILFIINSLIKKKKRDSICQLINTVIDKDSFDYSVEYTLYNGHATVIALAGLDLYDVFVAVGGDGTVSEIANVLVGTDKLLAIIPAGSGNGFANHLKISRIPKRALKKINDLKTLSVDTVKTNISGFINVAGVGFDALVAEKFSSFGRRGLPSYVFLSLREFFRYHAKDYKLVIDGKEFFEKAFLIAVANSSQFGNNFYISPCSDVTDGKMEICIIKKFPAVSLPFIALRLFLGNIDHSKFVNIIPAKHLKITSDERMNFHKDGNPVKLMNQLEIEVKPLSLIMVV